MADWYVRPDTSHSETRDGTEYQYAWGGWAAIVWGTGGVNAGDTLYICGTHLVPATIQMGAHGATVSSRVTLSGGYAPDPGALTITGTGGVFFFIHRSYTTIEDLTVTGYQSNCIYNDPTTGVTFQRCTFYGGGNAIIGLSAADTQNYTDMTIQHNAFIGGSGSTLGAAVSWTVAASGLPVSTLTRITIHNNTFTGCDAERAVVQLRIESGASLSAKMADIVITDNVFRDCPTLGMEIVGPSLTGNPSYYGVNTGIRVTGNKFYDMTNTDEEFNLGGAMGIGGFGPSLTSGFGSNIIARNEAYRITGPSGFLNTFYGTYRVFDNYAEDIYASQADGNAILIDHGSKDCIIYSNHFKRVIGNVEAENSGCGLMILDAESTTPYGNVFDGCTIGIYIGNKKAVAQSSNVYNNTFKDCSYAGILFLSTADLTTNLARRNIFTGTNSAPSVRVASGTMSGESGNCYHGFSGTQGHTLHASNVDIDPEFDPDYRPCAALTRTSTYLGGKDLSGKHFYDPPNYGAVDDVTATPRKALRKH